MAALWVVLVGAVLGTARGYSDADVLATSRDERQLARLGATWDPMTPLSDVEVYRTAPPSLPAAFELELVRLDPGSGSASSDGKKRQQGRHGAPVRPRRSDEDEDEPPARVLVWQDADRGQLRVDVYYEEAGNATAAEEGAEASDKRRNGSSSRRGDSSGRYRTAFSTYVYTHLKGMPLDSPLHSTLVMFTRERRLWNSHADCSYTTHLGLQRLPRTLQEMLTSVGGRSGAVVLELPVGLRMSGRRVVGDDWRRRVVQRWESDANRTRGQSSDDEAAWNSVRGCELTRDDRSERHLCDALMVEVDEKSGAVLSSARVHHALPLSYDSDWAEEYKWELTARAPRQEELMAPVPDDWQVRCINSDAGLMIDPQRGYVSAPGSPDSFTVHLLAQPVRQLGPVIVSFPDSRDDSPSVRVVPPRLIFDADNWHEPQEVRLFYLADGDAELCIHMTGGGFDQANLRDPSSGCPHIRVVTCVGGQVGYGCGRTGQQIQQQRQAPAEGGDDAEYSTPMELQEQGL